MSVESHCLPIAKTGYFSQVVQDYLKGEPALKNFFVHAPDAAGAAAALQARQKAKAVDRSLLVSVLKEQYQGVWEQDDAVITQVEKLQNENCFTVVTAHQPNVFTGPLYVVYKILHAIALCKALQKKHPENDFVPVYYMGSEDADLAELGQFTVDGFLRQWNTNQTGAVGRMQVDQAFLEILDSLKGQLGVLPHGQSLWNVFAKAYVPGRTMQAAMLHLVHALFGRWGLVVLVPDHPRLKAAFAPIIEKELFEQFSAPLVASTLAAFPPQYKAQAKGRELNLFYLHENRRERIEQTATGFAVANTDWQFTAAQMRTELADHPERFSPNVILRGVFQETILPNIAFVGGGGELAYWLELRSVFEATQTPFPQLVLRNSFLCLAEKQVEQWQAMGLSLEDLFLKRGALEEKWMIAQGVSPHSLTPLSSSLQAVYAQLAEQAAQTDLTLVPHVHSLEAKALHKLNQLDKKLFKAEKRKVKQQLQRIQQIQDQAFPQGSLQERTENFAGYYARRGEDWLEAIAAASQGWEQHFTILVLPEKN